MRIKLIFLSLIAAIRLGYEWFNGLANPPSRKDQDKWFD